MNAIRAITASIFVVALSGCAVFGDSHSPDCPVAANQGVHCMSAKEVYAATHNTDRIVQADPDTLHSRARGNGGEALTEADAQDGAGGYAPVGQVRTDYRPPVPTPEQPLPVRNPAKVMRIWIGPWEDDGRDLNAGSYVFTEVEGRFWSLGEEQVSRVESRVISPLASAPRAGQSQYATPLVAPTVDRAQAEKKQHSRPSAPAPTSESIESATPGR